MSIRFIKIYSTVGVSGQIETNVSTLGELKPLLAQREIDYSGMKLVIGATKTELSLDEAKLPEGDFKLYLMPVKTKSGSTNADLADLYEEQADLSARISNCLYNLETVEPAAAKPYASAEDNEDAEAMRELRRLNGGN